MENGSKQNQTSLESLTTNVNDLSSTIDFAHQSIKDLQNELTEERKGKHEILKQMGAVEAENKFLKTEVDKLRERAIDNENRNRRNCLEIDGVIQDQDETTAALESKLLNVFKTKMDVDPKELSIERCHRFGKLSVANLDLLLCVS